VGKFLYRSLGLKQNDPVGCFGLVNAVYHCVLDQQLGRSYREASEGAERKGRGDNGEEEGRMTEIV